ncbi:MAG TPA: hemolysin family protein [Candidatus Cloacimonas sp.]|nr:HlyC/CorC family transporter [Candidatus Cloacimonas sp.]MDD3733594.1 hemolysin family protein [Candidatus Cloacimonadota bacterium]MCK9164330.1 hemolysin family protein [Candidatus Cloacimonas sp.]HNZ32652.1 hemolysin family protein [Candidatus Cloacimonas sp.]HOG26214.1 hemolysin family protein [Candidatus Cloacimonas sp.]
MDDGKAFIIIVLFALSAFFSGSETALFSLSRVYLKRLENSKSKSAKRILKLLKKPRELLITLLLGNTFVNLAISSFGTLLALQIGRKYSYTESSVVTIQIILTTILILFFGEISPKLIALSKADTLSGILSLPLLMFRYLFYPIVWVLVKMSELISSHQNVDRYVGTKFTDEEFHNLIQSESSSHSLEEHEKKMLVGLFRFREAEIKEIYVPRVKITAIEENQSIEDLKKIIIESGYSRIPVYRGSIDEIVGIIYVKDLILYPEKKTIKQLMRPVWFVTENMKVQTLLNQFKQRKLQVAIVVDEYGGTSGIISLEDILEEIVGEIRDEYDKEEIPELIKIDENTYILSGNFSIRQFNENFSTDISLEDYDNLAEFLLAYYNHVPNIGDTVFYDERIEFTILDADEKSIKQIQVKIKTGELT